MDTGLLIDGNLEFGLNKAASSIVMTPAELPRASCTPESWNREQDLCSFARHTRIEHIHATLSSETLLSCLHTPLIRCEECCGHACAIVSLRRCPLPIVVRLTNLNLSSTLPQLAAAALWSCTSFPYDTPIDSISLGLVLFVHFVCCPKLQTGSWYY